MSKKLRLYQRIKKRRRDYPVTLRRSGWLLLLFAGIGVIGYVFREDRSGYIMNLITELAGILITVIFLDAIVTDTNKKELKSRLVARMGSRINSHAVGAVEEVKSMGWFKDNTLEEVYLREANLSGAHIGFDRHYDPDKAMCYHKLCYAILIEAQLKGAFLHHTDLTGSDFRNADLTMANLYDCNLTNACLEGANLTNANLEAVTWGQGEETAKFSAETILPNGEQYKPADGLEQLKQFTDKNAGNFWRPTVDVPYDLYQKDMIK